MASELIGGRFGLLVVETIAKIRRAYWVQQKPIKAICRELKVSRKVVRKGGAVRSHGIRLYVVRTTSSSGAAPRGRGLANLQNRLVELDAACMFAEP